MSILFWDDAIAWTVANRPLVAEALQADIAGLRAGSEPTPDLLHGAPMLDHWVPYVAGGLVYIAGVVERHPLWENGRLRTSTLCAIEATTFTWARTGSRYYRLGKHFGGFEILGRDN